ncbi:MAG: hypothetical protein IMZ64_12970 [Bacteroidetes bacterium]|nr:hypothetical protein [Bacteroidota bacterium]
MTTYLVGVVLTKREHTMIEADNLEQAKEKALEFFGDNYSESNATIEYVQEEP